MKLKLKAGTTSKLARIFIQDSSATDGSGLTALVHNSSGLTWYWIQEGDASATQVTLATMTVGTWASGGFREVDATNMPGVYEIGIPNAAIDANGTTHMLLKGATNMAPVAIEIECDAIDYVDSVRAGLTALPNAEADAAGGLPISDAGGLDMDGLSSHSAADVWTAVTRTLTSATNLTSDGSAITMSASGIVGTVNVVNTTTTNTDMRGTDNALLAANAPTNFQDLAITVTTGEVTVGINNDKAGYSISGTKTTLDALNDVSSASVADAIWDEATAGHVVGGTFGKMLVSIYDSQIAADGQINDVSATATAFITNLTEASDDHYNDAVITFVTGNLSGQSRVISDYDGATKTVTLDEALTEVPADGDEFLINTGHVHTESNIANAVLTQQMTESYAADGTAPTLAQAQFAIQQFLQETNVSGTTLTVKKLDGSTTAMTFTLDDATSPTSLTRAT